MRTILLGLLLAGLGGCSRATSLDHARRFQEAGERFLAAKTGTDFLQAAALYDSIRAEGVESGALFFNLGNCYLRAGQKGHAIAAYRQALRYRPTDPYLLSNLEQALSSDQRAMPRRRWFEHILFWQRWWSYPFKANLVTAMFAVTLVLAGLAQLLATARRALHRLALVSLLGTLVLAVSLALDYHQFERTRHGVVTVAEVIARKGNSQVYDPAFTQPLKEGAEFQVIDRQGDWLLIELQGAIRGWIPEADAVVY